MQNLESKSNHRRLNFKILKVAINYNLIASIARKYIGLGAEGIIIKTQMQYIRRRDVMIGLNLKTKTQ